MPVGGNVFDRDIAALQIAAIGKSFSEGGDQRLVGVARPAAEAADDGDRGLLCPQRREGGGKRQPGDELTPPPSMASSGRARSGPGRGFTPALSPQLAVVPSATRPP